MFSKPGRAKIGTNPSEIENWAKIRHKSVMLSALQFIASWKDKDVLMAATLKGVRLIPGELQFQLYKQLKTSFQML